MNLGSNAVFSFNQYVTSIFYDLLRKSSFLFEARWNNIWHESSIWISFMYSFMIFLLSLRAYPVLRPRSCGISIVFFIGDHFFPITLNNFISVHVHQQNEVVFSIIWLAPLAFSAAIYIFLSVSEMATKLWQTHNGCLLLTGGLFYRKLGKHCEPRQTTCLDSLCIDAAFCIDVGFWIDAGFCTDIVFCIDIAFCIDVGYCVDVSLCIDVCFCMDVAFCIDVAFYIGVGVCTDVGFSIGVSFCIQC